ncbi:hypothetical protein SERLA73DRAFT_70852 [Serpula lacrymans var. lacrymans S7.3]|uniref:HNH nuclease domain-containing protein n=2 Tax=Serpula lacrymans var. lacrymans TaxID=341189 RepID=F8PR25_SERL3|nr:uncharacterized protein SERLADRAFT_435102 [Serpula lacrymans var. lacrymans S7.9]EGO01682.1 hypothetical protein SERLA73DRAFT_70852 [Serpula lacrymans var. lacrymans S7.3]EGO27325.1 hypothetical protein SERLADRAFT_435102 [Serpula lacrymans var. lacrymans S7.9]
MTGTALSAELPSLLSITPVIRDAYAIILEFERSAQNAKTLIYARILGYLMLEGPSDQARVAIAREVISCAGKGALETNGKMYYDHYLRAFKRTKGHTPIPSSHVSRPSFDTCKAMIFDMLVEAPQAHQDAKKNALIRDGSCCVVTGNYERSMVENNQELEKMADDEGKGLIVTNCAHIFAESTNLNISGDQKGGIRHHHAASMWAVMDRFGYSQIPFDLNGSNIHRLENILTLDLWFEPTGTPNTYKLEAPVTFTTQDTEKLPLPSPEYLKIHAACARVAHLSGTGEHIDKISSELEDHNVLSEDGASADALEHALFPWSQQIQVF